MNDLEFGACIVNGVVYRRLVGTGEQIITALALLADAVINDISTEHAQELREVLCGAIMAAGDESEVNEK